MSITDGSTTKSDIEVGSAAAATFLNSITPAGCWCD